MSTDNTSIANMWKAVAALTARASEYPCATDASEDHSWGIAEGIREVFRQIPIPTLLTRLEAMERLEAVRDAEEREAKARAEREAAEAERKAQEAAERAERERLQAEADAKLRAEREAREIAEADARRIREEQEARERAERERAEAERLAREEAEAAAAAAPDAQKLEAFVDALLAVPAPEMATEPGRAALSLVLMARLNMCIEAKAIAAGGLVKRRRAK